MAGLVKSSASQKHPRQEFFSDFGLFGVDIFHKLTSWLLSFYLSKISRLVATLRQSFVKTPRDSNLLRTVVCLLLHEVFAGGLFFLLRYCAL